MLLRAFDALFTVFQHDLQSPRFDGGKCPLKKLSSKFAFGQAELLTIYIMLNLSSALVVYSLKE